MVIKFIIKLLSFGFVSRFSMVLAKLSMAGIPIIAALRIAVENISNQYLHSKMIDAISRVEQGSDLSGALDFANIYDNLAMGLIRAGEQSGEMVTMFENVAEYYERRFDAKVELVSIMIEPVMILFVGIIVFMLALGIFMPLWDMSGAIRVR